MGKLDEVLLSDMPLQGLEQAVRDHTDTYLGTVVLQASTLSALLHRLHAATELAIKIRPTLRALACTDHECAKLVEKLDKLLP